MVRPPCSSAPRALPRTVADASLAMSREPSCGPSWSSMTVLNPDLPKSVKQMLYLRRHRLLQDGEGRAAALIRGCGITDPYIESILADRVNQHAVAQAYAGPFPIAHLDRGELVLGLDQDGRVLRC